MITVENVITFWIIQPVSESLLSLFFNTSEGQLMRALVLFSMKFIWKKYPSSSKRWVHFFILRWNTIFHIEMKYNLWKNPVLLNQNQKWFVIVKLISSHFSAIEVYFSWMHLMCHQFVFTSTSNMNWKRYKRFSEYLGT